MEFEIKNLDFETLIKLADNAVHELERIANSLEHLDQHFVEFSDFSKDHNIKVFKFMRDTESITIKDKDYHETF